MFCRLLALVITVLFQWLTYDLEWMTDCLAMIFIYLGCGVCRSFGQLHIHDVLRVGKYSQLLYLIYNLLAE